MRTPTLFAGFALCITAMAGTPPTPAMLENLTPTVAAFEENKGQVRTTEGEAAPYVRYRLSQGNAQLFLLESGIAYQFNRSHYPEGYAELMAAAHHDPKKQEQLDAMHEQVRLETFRMDMQLEGANNAGRITTEGRSSDYTHYYNHDALDVHTYSKVTYHEVYPGIDWVLHTTATGIKQDFIVQPGADPSLIRLRYTDHEELYIDASGSLILGNRMGRFMEDKPVSFQDGKQIGTRFVLEGNLLRFSLENYDHSRTLTIDPDLIWGTYYGGTSAGQGGHCAVDGSGNVYLSCWTGSNGLASGGHQNAHAGNADVVLVKFGSNGVRLWATYYGGAASDYDGGIAVDDDENVYLSGHTLSSSGIASGGHQNALSGIADIFLVKFAADGTRAWATYYGGTEYERYAACAVDGSGNVFLAGYTPSTSGISSGGHQNSYGGGSTDAFLVKFSPSGVRSWATYYGGSGDEPTNFCATDGSGNVYLSGTTSSSAGISSGGHQSNYGGGASDLYLVKFGPSGSRIWATYYGGAMVEDVGHCTTDGSGNVFLAGSTLSTSGIASGGHQNAFGGGGISGGDGMLVKFNASGVRQWATYYGGSGSESSGVCSTDASGNIYLAGTSTSSSGIASGGYQMTNAGGQDAYAVKFDANGTRQWATYYGGNQSDLVEDCAAVLDNVVYISGWTLSSDGIALNGHQNTDPGPQQNGYLAKIGTDEPEILTTGNIAGSPFCQGDACIVPFTAAPDVFNGDNIFTAQLSDAGGSFDAPVDIGSLSSASSGTINATIPPGTPPGSGYRIRVTGSSPATIGSQNSAALTVGTLTTWYPDEDGDGYGVPTGGVEACGPPAGYVSNTTDDCPTVSGLIGSPCDDNDASTFGDVLDNTCTCIGTPDCLFAVVAESEPNNGNSTADPLPADTKIEGSLGACSPTDTSVDFFSINPISQGVLRVEACLATSGTVPLDVTFRVRVPSGSVLATYTLTAGANDAAITSFFEFPCQGMGAYFITIEVPGITACMSYAFSHFMLEPTFGNDPYPNPGVLHDTYQNGQNGFYYEESTYDMYNIVPPFNGLMTIEVQAEHAGPEPGTMQVRLYSTAGIVIEEWIMPTGASGDPITTMVHIGCLGNATDYDVRFYANDCGTSYRWKYNVSPPVFAPDPEGSTIAVNYDTYQEGQVGFVNDNGDTYSTTPALEGVMHFEIEAEHSGAEPGSMEFRFQYSGVPIALEAIPVGANGQPITTTVSVPCRGGSVHTVVFEDPVACGVSYRWRYYTTAPFFAIDAEPNNSTATAIVLPPDTDASGHLDFLTGVDNGGENVDFYRINLPADGVLHVNVEAEHVDASATETLEAVIVHSSGTVLASWDAPVGANSTPASSSYSLSCRGTTVPYYLRLISNTCGVSYRVSWSVTPAFFAADVEPNNSNPAGIPMDLSTAWYDGHIGFYNTTDDDFFKFTHAGGAYSVTVSAEHAGIGEGTMNMAITNSAGTVFGTFVVPVGGSSTPLTNTFTQPVLAAGSLYSLRFSDVTCGVSYRIHCANDADNDGICDVADLCPGGPEPGTPCDDGNAGTVNDEISDDCDCEGDLTTGLTHTDRNDDLRIWPNPATDEVWIDIGGGSSGTATVIVRDLLGRTIAEIGPIAADASGQYQVHLNAVAPGSYIIDVNVGGKRWSKRIVRA